MGPLFANFVHVQVQFRPRRDADCRLELPDGATAGDLLKRVGVSRDHVLVLRRATPIVETERLADGDEIVLLSAFSGG